MKMSSSSASASRQRMVVTSLLRPVGAVMSNSFSGTTPERTSMDQNRALNRSVSRITQGPLSECGTPKSSNGEVYSVERFGTPKSRALATPSVVAEQTNFVVALRPRPLTARENENKKNMTLRVEDQSKATIVHYGQLHTFCYDHCFTTSEKQEHVYEILGRPLLTQALKGFNISLFAYGQTGTGKTHSIMGCLDQEDAFGIVPLFCNELFDELGKRSSEQLVTLSYYEIYKEKIYDLLNTEDYEKKQLRVREHPIKGPYVEDLFSVPVLNFDQVHQYLTVGNRRRVTAATAANDRSSRSHAVVTLTLTQSREEYNGTRRRFSSTLSRVNFVDLAGSERVAVAKTSGLRREEGLKINQSLLTLGRVITALAEQSTKKHVFVPYRESLLTWLLKDSLGGDAKTALLATVSPCEDHIEETMSTLRYACQARKIVNVARINEDPNLQYIRQLQDRLEALESGAGAVVADSSKVSDQRTAELEREIQNLKGQLAESEQRYALERQRQLEELQRQKEELDASVSSSTLDATGTQDPDVSLPVIEHRAFNSSTSDKLEAILRQADGGIDKHLTPLLNLVKEANDLFKQLRIPCAVSIRTESSVAVEDDRLSTNVDIRRQDLQQTLSCSPKTLETKLALLRRVAGQGRSSVDVSQVFPNSEHFRWEDELTGLRSEEPDFDLSSNVFDDTSALLDRSTSNSLGAPSASSIAAYVREMLTQKPRSISLSDALIDRCASVLQLLSGTDHGSRFLVGVGVFAHPLPVELNSWISSALNSAGLIGNLRNHWLETAAGAAQDADALVIGLLEMVETRQHPDDVIADLKKTVEGILSLIGEVAAVSGEIISDSLNGSVKPQILSGFQTAHWRVHDAVWQCTESVAGFLLRHLPVEGRSSLPDSFGSVTNSRWQLIKLCHDIAVQAQSVLEKLSDTADSTLGHISHDLTVERESSHKKIGILLSVASSLTALSRCVEDSSLSELDRESRQLEGSLRKYAVLLGLVSDGNSTWSELDELGLAVSSLHNHTAEQKRRAALLRGRDVDFSPIPARLLASPGFNKTRKRLFRVPSFEEVNGTADGRDSDEDEGLSDSVIQRALNFKEPGKSNLKTAQMDRIATQPKNVRFDVPNPLLP